jgi:succinyl-diaminopimelate desuccinylase
MRVDAVQLTRELVAIESVNPTTPERRCTERAAALLEQGGFSVKTYEFAPGRASVVARLPGGGDAKPICFAGHLDTVPIGGRPWSHDPFGGEVADGKLYGRGSSDMKSGAAAMIAAVLDLARFERKRAGITVILVAGEETGCEGAAHLARQAGAIGEAGALVIGEPTSNRPLIEHKGALWLRARTRGVSVHSSLPEQGVNAIYKAARAVLRASEFRFDVAPDPILGMPTLCVGTISGGMSINSVADQASFTIDIRPVPGQKSEEMRATLASLLGPDVELTPIVDLEAVRTNPDHPWVRDVFAIVSAVTGDTPKPEGVTYFTDASILTRAFGGVPTVVLGPGDMVMCHQTDECCRIDRIEQSVAMYRDLARKWCGV